MAGGAAERRRAVPPGTPSGGRSAWSGRQLGRLPGSARFGWLVARHPEFRSLVHHRLTPLPWPVRRLLRLVHRPLPTLHLNCAVIGPELFIEHGFATTLTARSVGRDCRVDQQVTVGRTGRGPPSRHPALIIGGWLADAPMRTATCR